MAGRRTSLIAEFLSKTPGSKLDSIGDKNELLPRGKEVPSSARRSSRVRWDKLKEIFILGKYPKLSWDLYDCHPNADKEQMPKVEDFFRIIQPLGSGSFGKVFLVETHLTGERLAMKMMDKADSSKRTRDKELRALILIGYSPFIVRYHSCFQTVTHAYILMQYYSGGSLASILTQTGKFSDKVTRFYAAEVVEGLLYLHNLGIIHRDIKLANILLGNDDHIRICDMGLCKLGMSATSLTHTKCGALRYTAPEVLKREPYGKMVDWWSFGVVLFRMLTGKYPYDADDSEKLERVIATTEPKYKGIEIDATDIIKKFLTKNSEERLGAGAYGESDIRGHPYFRSVEWVMMRMQRYSPPSLKKRYLRRGSLNKQFPSIGAFQESRRRSSQESEKFSKFILFIIIGSFVMGSAVAVLLFYYKRTGEDEDDA